MTVDYDPNLGTLHTALCLKDTVISQVLQRFEFYALILSHVALRSAYQFGYFSPEDLHLRLPMSLTGVTGSLMTFFVVFYNGNVFSRYNKFYDLTKNLNENCLNVVMMLTREVSDQRLKRKLVRMILASCFLFFFERTPVEESEDKGSEGNISNAEWAELVRLGLLDRKQEARLKEHCLVLGKNAMPSLVLLHWSMKLYRLDPRFEVESCSELEKAYWDVRRMQDDVVEMLELPMPWQYFHIMNVMMMLNLMLWAYSFALEESHFASVIFLFVAAIFMGIRELSVALADPYGDDAADFPLNEWMNQLYVRVLFFCEDTWDPNDMMLGILDEPLYVVKKGNSVVDLLMDLGKNPSKGKRNSSKGLTAAKTKSRNERQEVLNPAQDGAGSYTQIPAMIDEDEEGSRKFDIED